MDPGRDASWTLSIAGQLIAQHSSVFGLVRTDAAAQFANNIIPGKSLSTVSLHAGDRIEWITQAQTYSGHFVGVDITVALSTSPIITKQPQSQLGYWGKSASFSVIATNGVPPYGYQWMKDGLAISSGTNSVLVLTNLQTSDVGTYTVLVSDTVTNLLSQPATLTVNPAGVAIALYAGVTIDGVAGQTYGIQSTMDLSNTNSWAGRANVTLTNATQLWYDSRPATQPQTYYHVLPGPISIP